MQLNSRSIKLLIFFMLRLLIKSNAFAFSHTCIKKPVASHNKLFSTMSTRSLDSLNVALCQIKVGENKNDNILHAREVLQSTKIKGSQFLVLPECWNSPYSTLSFPKYAEYVPDIGEIPDESKSPSIFMLCEEAKSLNAWIVGGSVPERVINNDIESLYNTCVIINSSGNIVGKHRKVHLFDIDVPGKIRFKESDSLSAGSSTTVVDSPWGPIGVGICYDIRFPELAILMRKAGCNIIIYPGAFNMVTGPVHWELLQRARAVDNQLFVLSCSPARDESAGYIAWGHSMASSPWGTVLATASAAEEIVTTTLDLTEIDKVRQNIPCWTQKRHDVYSEVSRL